MAHFEFEPFITYIKQIAFSKFKGDPINPYHDHAEFLKWNNLSYIFGTFNYHFQGYQNENLKLVSQQYIDIPKNDNGQFQIWKMDYSI